MLFPNEKCCVMFHAEMVVLEDLAQDALDKGESCAGVGEMYDDLLSEYTLCKGRDCRTCDGVRCEDAFVDRTSIRDLYHCTIALWKSWLGKKTWLQ